MIYIRVEMWPNGDSSRSYLLGEGHVINDITGTMTRGNYLVRLWGKRGGGVGRGAPAPMRAGEVKGFPRKSLHAWELIYRALAAALKRPAPPETTEDEL